MLYVVYGYCGPDHYTSKDNHPLLEIKRFSGVGEVEEHYKKFMEGLGKEADKVTYRVFDGTERNMVPVTKVTEYKLT